MIKYYNFDSKIGELHIYIEDEIIVGLSFGSKDNDKNLKKYYEKPVRVDINDYNYHEEILKYLDGELKEFTLPFNFKGTAFQMKVWKALLDIPYGETRTYGDIANKIGSPRGYRAVGGALNKNPISIIVPCHRVIGSSGKLVGFGGGVDTKEKLLKLEKENK